MEQTPGVSSAGGGRCGLPNALLAALESAAASDSSVFLLGADAGTIRDVEAKVLHSFPELRLSGICDGDFADAFEAPIIQFVSERRPDLIITDLPPRRHHDFARSVRLRLKTATLVNAPGSFQRVIAASRNADARGSLQGPRGVRRIARPLLSLLAFARLVFRQGRTLEAARLRRLASR